MTSPVDKKPKEISSDHLHVTLLGRILRDADKDAKNSIGRDETKLENQSGQKMPKSVKFKLPVSSPSSQTKKTGFITRTHNDSTQLYTNKFLLNGQRTQERQV